MLTDVMVFNVAFGFSFALSRLGKQYLFLQSQIYFKKILEIKVFIIVTLVTFPNCVWIKKVHFYVYETDYFPERPTEKIRL